MSSDKASVYLHGFASNNASDPPPYNDIVKMNDIPSAPLLEPPERSIRSEPTFSSIFGVANTVQFEWNSSDSGCSFLIRGEDGSLQAKGDATNQNTIVQSVNGMEMLKIIEGDADEMLDGNTVHKFRIIHKHEPLGTVKVVGKTPPLTSLQIFDRNGSPVVVNSLKIGDYAIFRENLSSTPLCNIQMPKVETYNDREFNVKIIFHPQSGITHDEQLLCTAAAIAFKTKMRETTNVYDKKDNCIICCWTLVCVGVFILLLVVFIIFMIKWNCEYKKARYESHRYRQC